MSGKNFIKRLITKCDCFGVNLNFQINNNPKYKSILGGSVFLIYFIFCITYFFLGFNDFINRQQITLVYYEGQLPKSATLDLNKLQAGFAFGLTGDSNDKVNMTTLLQYLNITWNVVTQKKQNNKFLPKERQQLLLKKCNQSHFYNNLNYDFALLNLQNFLCPNLTNVEIKGTWDEDIFIYFELTAAIRNDISDLDNGTTKIRELFKANEIKLELYYVDTSINVYDFKTPIQQYISSKFLSLDWQFYKKLNVDMVNIIFNNDANLFTKEEKETKYIGLGSVDDYFQHIGETRIQEKNTLKDWNILCKMYVRSSKIDKKIKRNYMKLDGYLANLTGIFSTLLFIISTLMIFINTMKAKQSIMKELFQYLNDKNLETSAYVHLKKLFENDKISLMDCKKNQIADYNNIYSFVQSMGQFKNEKNLIPNNTVDSPIKSENGNQNFDYQKNIGEYTNDKFLNNSSLIKSSQRNINNVNNNEYLIPKYKLGSKIRGMSEKTIPILKKNSLSIKYSFCSMLKRYILFCNNDDLNKLKFRIHDEAFKKFNNEMDIYTYIRKMREIDILKYLIMNNDQIHLVNMISKPSFSHKSRNSILESFESKFACKFDIQEAQRIFSSFNNLFIKDKITDLDRKILNIASTEIDNIIGCLE